METDILNEKITTSVKWASITEIAAKLITPFTSMLLARLLTPDEFGVVATVTMVTSFADVFTDAGFQKYLIQKHFENDKEFYENANVAFWTNLSISLLLWIIIVIYRNPIATQVGNPGLGHVIAVASVSLFLTAFSSIQMAIYKKKFDFKTLFLARIVGVFMPVVITVPLAFMGFGYWSIIWGTIATNLANAIILTIKSTWKPYLFYSFSILKKMFSFSMWTLLESILLWMTSYIGTFIIGKYLTSYYLGLYKNSISMVTSVMNIVAASTTSVLLSALSSVKNDKKQFDSVFYSFQQKVGLLLIPLGVGVFLFRDLATSILFGAQWSEASLFVGLYSLAQAFTILTGQYISLTFTANERPKLSVLSQILQLIELVALLLVTVNKGFIYIVFARCIARAMFGVINLIIGKIYIGMSPVKIIKNLMPAIMGSFTMVPISIIGLSFENSFIWQIVFIALCCISYGASILIMPQSRKILLPLIEKTLKRCKKIVKN
ncbi:lipopolysaccharide biosynthesis protein [Lactonifactor longoviformis]|uniref:lipopolysaccharide biosynthesis protein n=1 Tax=Lactonifactor longoviformis TaxID=341220 RepID=UPI00210B9DD1|nr:lipopolysaccharide biosynthesis protein [Lactonifactor longoviformis]MCQ4672653.1 lipopolysaccharide biosynthesis protein [Lactonifactor longoviformis]